MTEKWDCCIGRSGKCPVVSHGSGRKSLSMSNKNSKELSEKSTMKPIERARLLAKEVLRDSVQVRVPRAFLPAISLFLHHSIDAMFGDDRPDHGLAKVRAGKDAFKVPTLELSRLVRRAMKRTSKEQERVALRTYWAWQSAERQVTEGFLERLTKK